MSEIDRALAYLDQQGRPVDAAWARAASDKQGKPTAALNELASYQNEDGGFGNGLEPDISAPASNPFAARIALQIFCNVGVSPGHPMVQELLHWLVRNQDHDGGWRFSDAIYEDDLAPWFAGWTFPNLNPSLDLAGYVSRLQLDAPDLQRRTRTLFQQLASLDTIQDGSFYTLLPFMEYTPWVDHPNRNTYLAALITRITLMAETGEYEDAGHFFEHVGPAGGPIARGLRPDLIAAQLERLRSEQQPDGGWPTAYSKHWRSWATAASVAILSAYGAV